MRKILAFVICCFGMVVMPSFASAAGSCTPIICDASKFNTREMLSQDGVTGGPNNNDDGRFTSQLCYMCDTGGANSQCNYNDTVVIANDGGQHIAFQCTDTFGPNDTWTQMQDSKLGVCGDSPLNQMDGYIENSLLSEIRQGQTAKGATSVSITQTGRYDYLCRYRRCLDGYRAVNGKYCVSVSQSTQTTPETVEEPAETVEEPAETVEEPAETVDETVPGPELSNTERCIRNRCGGLSGSTKLQCDRCCYVPSSVATWNKDTRVCECPNTSTHVFNPSTLQCEPIEPSTPSQPVASTSQSVTQVQSSEQPDYECDQTQINNLLTLQVQYATNTSIVAQINQVIEYCDGDPSEIVFNSMINQINIAISGVNTQAEQNQANQRIDQAVATLNTIRDGLRVNKWRNEEGKFNTSRLLSDSIAGVVLGTAGGLITSSVVKKSQVSDGFEDMQCTIGGQVVAGWGDQFRVGIQ